MTSRHDRLTVVLDEQTRVDDLEPLIEAISRFEGVAGVEPAGSDQMALVTLRNRLKIDTMHAVADVFDEDRY